MAPFPKWLNSSWFTQVPDSRVQSACHSSSLEELPQHAADGALPRPHEAADDQSQLFWRALLRPRKVGVTPRALAHSADCSSSRPSSGTCSCRATAVPLAPCPTCVMLGRCTGRGRGGKGCGTAAGTVTVRARPSVLARWRTGRGATGCRLGRKASWESPVPLRGMPLGPTAAGRFVQARWSCGTPAVTVLQKWGENTVQNARGLNPQVLAVAVELTGRGLSWHTGSLPRMLLQAAAGAGGAWLHVPRRCSGGAAKGRSSWSVVGGT